MSSALIAPTERSNRTVEPDTVMRRCGTITLRPAPPREPPFDDERPDAPAPYASPLDPRLPFESARRPRPIRPNPDLVGRRAALPDPAQWGQRLLVGIIETAGGHRPVQQLTGLLSPAVARGLLADFDRAAQSGRAHWTHAATVHSVRASEPRAGVAELSATVRAGARIRAIAMRLEVVDGRWRCTLLQLG